MPAEKVNKGLRRISLMVRDDQHQQLLDAGLNVSGLIRDLIDDYLSDFKITLSVTEETRRIYDRVVSNTGATDGDLEKYIVKGLKDLLKARIHEMQELEKNLK
jgi:hypothetical protein